MALKEDKERIQGMIDKTSALELELVWIPRIMERQTDQEIDANKTIEHNDVGLNGVDAVFISDIFDKVNR